MLQFSQGDINRSPLTTIKAFQSGKDTVDLSRLSTLGPFSALDLVDTSRGVELRIDDSVILFQGRTKAQLSASDFLLAIDEPANPPDDPVDPPDDPVNPPDDPVDPPDDPVDPFLGTEGDDTINSDENDNLIQGLGGNDVLAAGVGADVLIGGSGSDKFVVRLIDGGVDPTVDVVKDFSYISGDRIGLTEVLSGVPFSDIRDVFRATPQDGDTIIAVKPRGDASAAFQDVLRLEGVTFTTEQLLTHGITAPPVNSTTFVENPYGFQNRSLASANPEATKDGAYVVWVDRLNLDDSPFDFTARDLSSGDGRQDQGATRDVFLLNTQTNVLQRVTDREGDADERVEAVSPVLSADGRYVAYVEEREGFGGQQQSFGDVYVRDMANPELAPVLVSVGDDGDAGDAGSPIENSNRGSNLSNSTANQSLPVVDISDDGRKIAFVTKTSLDAADTDTRSDVYLRDLDAGTTRLISVDDNASNGASSKVKISGDGRYIGFTSNFGFDPIDQDGSEDVYLFDTQTGEYLLISSPIGGNISGFDMSASADRFVFSTDEAINPNDNNGLRDIYVADVDLSAFSVTSRQRVSEAEGRFELRDGDSYAPTISQDGDRIAFLSQSQALIPFRDDFYEDSNGDFAEKLFLLNLPTGEISLPTIDAAVGPAREELSTHLSFTDLGFVYRPGVSSNTGSAGIIANGVEKSSDADDIGTVTIDRNDVVRSSIDSASDVDIFRIKSQSSTTRDLFVSIEAASTGVGTLSDPQVRVLKTIGNNFVVTDNADGSGLAIDNDSGVGSDAFVGFDTSTNGDRFIEVSSADGSIGSYVLRVGQNVEPLDGPLPTADDFIF